jgi:hypothetical protein
MATTCAAPTFPGAEAQTRALQAAAETLSLQLRILHASTERDFDYALYSPGRTARRPPSDRNRSVLQQLTSTARGTGAPPRDAYDLSHARIHYGRQLSWLRQQQYGLVASDRHLSWPNSQGREARGPAGDAAHQI